MPGESSHPVNRGWNAMKKSEQRWKDSCLCFYEWGIVHALADRLRGTYRKRGGSSSPDLVKKYDECILLIERSSTAAQRKQAFSRYCGLLKQCFNEGYNRDIVDRRSALFKEKVSFKDFPLVWRGYFFSASGYGQGTHSYVSELIKKGFTVCREELNVASRLQPGFHRDIMLLPRARWPVAGAMAYISHTPPFAFERREGTLNVGITTWETTRIPPDWVKLCNSMNELWVASRFNERAFIESGVKTPIKILPYGVDTDTYHRSAEPIPFIPGTAVPSKMLRSFFCFLSIGALYPYKGYDALLSAYIQEFSPKEPVMLLLKVYHYFDRGHEDLRQVIRSICDRRGVRKPPHIFVIRHTLEREMPGLMQLSDAYISTSRGEGFCLPLLEAMAMGKIVLSVAFGGPRDYLREDNSFFIDHKEVPVVKGTHPYHNIGSWAEPDVEHIRHQMRWVFEHPAEAAVRAEKAAKDVRTSWTKARAGARLERHINNLYGHYLSRQ
jgi:glycosyltransferase involved in cell wall biosynthesis